MIAKDTTVAVNFLVLDMDGFPATGKASNISATISINGTTATAISDTITEKGSGWYYFSHYFTIAGNVFIEFSCTGCIVMPWEDDVVEISTGSPPSAATIANAVWSDRQSYAGPIDGNPGAPATKGYLVANPETWSQLAYNNPGQGQVTYGDLVKGTATNVTNIYNNMPTEASIAEEVWTTTLSGITPSVNSTYQKMVSIPANVWTNNIRSLTTRTVTYQGTTSEIASSSATDLIYNAMATYNDLVILQRHGDESWVTASTSGLATATDVSNAQTAIINALPSTTGLATSSDVSAAEAAIIAAMPDVSNLSTFDPSNDDVNVNSTSISAIQSGLATSSDISTSEATIIAAIPDVSGLSTFDPASTDVNVSTTSISDIQTGLATSTDVTAAVTALETYGDTNWSGGGSGPSGGGITAEDVWKYSGTYGRTLSESPTDISTLATKTDVSNAQTAIINAMPSTTGLATATDVSSAQTAIINAIPAVPNDYAKPGDTMDVSADSISSIKSGLATATDVTNAQAAVIAEIPDISGLSTFNPANETVSIDPEQAATMVTATGFATPSDIPTDDITAIKEKVDTLENTDLTGIATSSDVSTAQAAVIAAIPSDYAKASDLTAVQNLLVQLDAGVLHWATSATHLTLYKEDNTVLRVYTLERDTQGNITRISPANA